MADTSNLLPEQNDSSGLSNIEVENVTVTPRNRNTRNELHTLAMYQAEIDGVTDAGLITTNFSQILTATSWDSSYLQYAVYICGAFSLLLQIVIAILLIYDGWQHNNGQTSEIHKSRRINLWVKIFLVFHLVCNSGLNAITLWGIPSPQNCTIIA